MMKVARRSSWRRRVRLAFFVWCVVEIGVLAVARARAQEQAGAELEDDESPPPCSTTLRLSGTLYDDRHPERSFALLHVKADQPGQVYREGDAVQGFELRSIEPTGAVMRGDHGLCWLNIMSSRAGQPAPRAPSARPPRRRSHSAFSEDELKHAIFATGTHSYDVERSLISRAVERAGQIARNTQFDQVRHYGSVAGMRLRNLAKHGLLAHLGLQRGDLIKSLNGVAMTGVENTLMAESLVKSTSRLSLLVMRGGQPLTLDYHVID
jgi:general secretion pathway protein C